MIYELLKKGRSNAIKGKQIDKALNITPRERRRILADERKAGHLILMTTSEKGGYFLPSDDEIGVIELQECYKSLLSMAITTLANAKNIRAELKKRGATHGK